MRLCGSDRCKTTTYGQYCSTCGERTIPYYMDCPHCRKLLAVVNKFCSECGKPVQEEVAAFKIMKRKEVNAEETRMSGDN